MKKTTKQQTVDIPALEIATAEFTITGISPLIVHAWSPVARQQMLCKQMGKATAGREKKDPVAQCLACLYIDHEGRPCFPAGGIKASAVTAANDVDLMKTMMKRGFHILGSLLPIDAPELSEADMTDWDRNERKRLKDRLHRWGGGMREDMVRLATGVCDIAHRPCFPKWSITFAVEYNRRVVTIEQLAGLLNAAGFGVGIGDWRPSAPKSASGNFGRFRV